MGLALAYGNNIVINLNAMIYGWVRTETQMVGVERILEYSQTLPQERGAAAALARCAGAPPPPSDSSESQTAT